MKTKYILLLLGLGSLLYACDKNELYTNITVDQFATSLKTGDSTGNVMPNFEMEQVGNILQYAQDTFLLNYFPSNPLSSYSSDLKQTRRLNECFLWMIDGIRFKTRYPSFDPCLIDTCTEERVTTAQLLEIAKLYDTWYENYLLNPTEAIQKEKFLLNTPFRWE